MQYFMGSVFRQIKAFKQPAKLLQTDALDERVGLQWPGKLVTPQVLLP
jgi:hypothetical protein